MQNLLIDTFVTARTPRHLGVNIEIQDAADQTNLWDWLAHSNATALREFHPERTLRRAPAAATDWAGVTTRDAFDAWREGVRSDPQGAVRWDDYLFAEPVPWLGVPDDIVRKARELSADPLLSMGWAPDQYPVSLVANDRQGPPTDADIHWPGACCAYEYYFAMIWRYASRCGVRYFMLHNEPEYHAHRFHMPPDLAAKDYAQRTSDDWRIAAEVTARQVGVMSRLARLAMEDVRTLLPDPALAASLVLSAVAAHWQWERYWQYAHEYVDTCDFHHYGCDESTFRREYARAAMRAGERGKRTAVTEFNRLGGPIRAGDMLHCMGPALDVGGLLMTALELAGAGADDPPCEAATFYHFRFPATHRNFKCLAYGDMNCVDWTGTDIPLVKRGEEWYPTFEELQVRFATPAYAMFRMLARCAPGGRGETASHDVLRVAPGPFTNPQTQRVDLRFQAIRAGTDLFVNLLNPHDAPSDELEIDVSRLAGACLEGRWCGSPQRAQRQEESEHDPIASSADSAFSAVKGGSGTAAARPDGGGAVAFRTAVIREASLERRDDVVAQHDLSDGETVVTLTLPPQSLTQIRFTPLPLARVSSLRLEERTTTPGGVGEGLGLWQTTLLRAIGTIDGTEHDLTEVSARFVSERSEVVRAHPGGLVQRMRQSERPVAVHVETPAGVRSEAVAF